MDNLIIVIEDGALIKVLGTNRNQNVILIDLDDIKEGDEIPISEDELKNVLNCNYDGKCHVNTRFNDKNEFYRIG